MQDRLKKNEKSQNQFQNGLMHIGRIQVKKGQRTDLSQTKKILNIVNILKNKIEQIKKSTNLLPIYLKIVWKRTEENRKTAESFTKWIKLNQKNSKSITRWTRANRQNKKN